MPEINLIKIYENSFRDNFDMPALTDYGDAGHTATYGDMARDIARIHMLFERLGVAPGDHIALLGKSCASWTTVFMATITYGAVIVPILHEFAPDDARNIINHSDSVLLFITPNLYAPLGFEAMPALKAALSMDTLELLDQRDSVEDAMVTHGNIMPMLQTLDEAFDARFTKGFGPDDIKYGTFADDSTAEINYTSGTTGNSKGVMLTLGNLGGNVVFGMESQLHYKGSRVLNFLPLAHAYGCAFDMLVPLAVGSHITFLDRQPTPKILARAFAEVRPSLVCCVPLVLEKIYKRMIVPALNRRPLKIMAAIPGVRRILYHNICRRLTRTFGNEFEEVIVGGAPLSGEVENFLKRIHFRFTVGYGMTECGPLISYTPWREFVAGSSGRVLPGIMQVKILSDDPEGVNGEIMVRGINVMKGYYKRPDLTAEAIDADGWLHTGDMGVVGSDMSTIFIHGRYKTMILGPSGQNIYPESIEARLNGHKYVSESIIIDRGGRLNAIVVPDADALEGDEISVADHHLAIKKAVKDINTRLASYERISDVELSDKPLEKTPKKSIKRYLYDNRFGNR